MLNNTPAKLKNDALIEALKSVRLYKETTINFTLREIECMAFWLRGYSAKQIGEKFNISHRTVQTHVERFSKKINCRKRVEVIDKIHELRLDKLMDDVFYFIARDNEKNGRYTYSVRT